MTTLSCLILTPRPLHIAVVQGNLPAVHRLVNLFQHGGRELDIYNNLRQVRLGTEEDLGALMLESEGLGAQISGSDYCWGSGL